MEIVMVLVPLMLMLVGGGILLFNWAVKNGQYDDLEGPAHRILYDDDKDRIPPEARNGLEKTRRNTTAAEGDSEAPAKAVDAASKPDKHGAGD